MESVVRSPAVALEMVLEVVHQSIGYILTRTCGVQKMVGCENVEE